MEDKSGGLLKTPAKEAQDLTVSSKSPYFKSAAARQTSVLLLRNKTTQQHVLVTSLAVRQDTQVIRIISRGGKLHYDESDSCNFDDEAAAIAHLGGTEQHEVIERGCALLGYAPIGLMAFVILATRVRPAATLPGGHLVRLVADSRWLQIPLQEAREQDKGLSPDELERLEMMHKYVLSNAHFYCETVDISRPFPSSSPLDDPSWEFVWNRWLSAALRAVGLPTHCPHLMQGVAESRSLEDCSGQKYTLALLARRSCLHPGMRYIARGLNGLASPGNEIECEQIVWTQPASLEVPLKWSSYTWRRGTVPIWWGVELKSGGVGEATIVIPSATPYRGTRRYFRRLQKRYTPDSRIKADLAQEQAQQPEDSQQQSSEESPRSSTDASLQLPITCINLLRCNMQRQDELMLSEAFHEGTRQVRKGLGPGTPLQIINFDWHGMIRDLKEKETVRCLWEHLRLLLPRSDLSAGTMELTPATATAHASQRCCTKWDDRWHMRWQSQQHGLERYNCADSLDRTNAASYFGAVQVLAEQARRLGIVIEAENALENSAARAAVSKKKKDPGYSLEISSIHRRVKEMMKARTAPEAEASAGRGTSYQPVQESASALPSGWEARTDESSGRTFYMDHNTKKTTWVRPEAKAEPPQTPSQPTSSGRPPQLPQSASEQTLPSGRRVDIKLQTLGRGDAAGSDSEASDTDAPSISGSQHQQKADWGLLGLGVDDVRVRLLPDVVAEQAEMFLINGDMQSNLYTSSRAMHSAILGLLQNEASSMSKAGIGKLQNLSVTVQRRWNNVLADSTRQLIIEMFLGLRLNQHFPSARFPYTEPLPQQDESDTEEEASSPMPKQQAILKQQGVSPQLVSQQVLMQHPGQEPEPEVAASSGRADAAEDDDALMDGVSRQLPGKRIDDYLSMLSTESTSSNNQPDGPGQLNSDMQLEEISLI
ncbi:hypothetical protein ABBQ38_013936 [Trebouxia sp. C0009 RCD-2024]